MIPRKLRLIPIVFLAGILMSSCAAIVKKESFDFKTTSLFIKTCKELEEAKLQLGKEQKKGFWQKVNPAQLIEEKGTEKIKKIDTTVNECKTPDLEKMTAAFMSIKETDETRGIRGDTMEEVRNKGFTIYSDDTQKVRRPNTRPLYGNEALTEVGMGVSQPPLQKPEDIKAYNEIMGQIYGQMYVERGMRRVEDRICINNDDSLDIGDDYTFVIVWRNDYVFKRVVKGGPINNPKKKYAFLVCPGGFIGDMLKGITGSGVKMLIP